MTEADEKYFEHPAVSASALSVFRRSRRLYHARYVAKTMPSSTTARLDLGSACHVAVLEPDTLNDRVTIAPDVNRRTKAGRDELAAFEAENSGKLILSPADFEKVVAVRDAVMSVKLARQLIEREGTVEQPVFWHDAETFTHCKAKPDKHLPNDQVVVDLKTTTDASEWGFGGSVAKFNYGLQAAHYLAGTEAERFVWVVVAIEPPHEVALYELNAEGRGRAKMVHQRTLHELSEVMLSGEWNPQPTTTTEIELPKWWQ